MNLKDLTTSETIIIIVAIWISYLIISGIIKRLFKKKKPKSSKEYEVVIFDGKLNYSYPRGELEKVKVFGRKYIAVYPKDGTCIEYEGFCFIVKTYKVKIEPITEKQNELK